MQRTETGLIGPLAALPEGTRRGLWIVLLGLSSIGFSLALACATPFAALAALAAVNMIRRDAFGLIGLVWLANQVIGYGILEYPHSIDSYAWGAAIGIAAGLGLVAAMVAGIRTAGYGGVVATASAFIAAFSVYELVLYPFSFVLPGSDEAFSWPIVGQILVINALALAGLVALHRMAVWLGLVTHATTGRGAAHI